MSATKPKLCLITTGGTIGMVRDGAGVARPAAQPLAFLGGVPGLGSQFEVEIVPLLNKDSSNITPCDWALVSETIMGRMGDGFDGIVVTHGTDTMAYTAAAVALALGRRPLARPVVFTGAMRASDAAESDGPLNLMDACGVASGDFGEVLIVMGGRVLRAVRASKTRPESLDAFESIGDKPVGVISEASTVWDKDRIVRGGGELGCEHQDREPCFTAEILPVWLSPGVGPSMFRPLVERGEVRGVLLQTMGAGNVPSEGKASWLKFIRDATASDIPVLLTSATPSGIGSGGGYAPGCAALEAGAINAGSLTPACAAVKFRWALGQARRRGGAVVSHVREVMDRDWVGEMGSGFSG